MSISVASVSIPTELHLGGFNSGLNDLEKTKIKPLCIDIDLDTKAVEKQRKDLERLFSKGLDLKIRVDDSALTDLNEHLDLKDDHVERLQSKWNRNPLTIRVDTSEIDDATAKLESLEKRSKSKSKTTTGTQSISSASSDISSALEQGMASASQNIKKSIDILTKPLQETFSGLFQGIGHTVSERLTKGVMGTLEKKGALKMDGISEGIADFLQTSSSKISKSLKTEAKSQPQKIDLSNLSSLKQTAERVAVDLIPPEVPRQLVQQFQTATKQAGQIVGHKIVDALQDDFDLLTKVLSQTKPDLSKAEAQFDKIRGGFKSAYANLNDALAKGNTDLAETYQKTIVNMAKMARQEIDKVQAQLKAEGADNRFGAKLPTIAGSTKGQITQYENRANRKSIDINKQRAKAAQEAVEVGSEVVKGVSKGLSTAKPVEQQSAAIGKTIIKTLKDDLEIRSPSKKGIQIGIDFVRGIGVGISSTARQVVTQGKKLSQNIQGSLTSKKAKAPKSATEVAHESAVQGMNNFYDSFGQKFKQTVFKGMPDSVANEMAGEVAGMIFSGFSMAFPSAIGAVGLGPLLVAALPTVITGLGLNKLLSPIIARTVEGIKQVDPIRQRFEVLGGSKEAGKAEFDYANKVAERYSVSKESSLGQYSQLAIAARGTKLEGEGVKELFEGIAASTKALKLSTADSNLVFMAYTQMLAKGKISMEELRQQLGERFPPAMGVFAKAMGVSVGEMGQLIESGNALSEDVLPRVGSILKQDFGNAAAGGGGLLTAFTAIENAGFDLSVKLAETFSGLFGAIVNFGAGIFNVFNKNFDLILKLGAAFVIGVTAQLAVGLQQLTMMPGIAKALAGVQGAFLSTFSKSMTMLAPFMFGMFIDIADDFLGAQNSIFDNMSKGVTNAILAVVTLVDDASRNLTGSAFFKPDHDNALIGFFLDIADKIKSVVQILPPGVVEMGALMIMFEQVSVLGKMFLVPTFQNFATALGGMRKGLVSAFTSGQNLKSMFRMMIADSAMAKGAMIALGVAVKGALAFGVMAFAQGDFADDLAKDFSKAEVSIVNSIKSIGTELDGLKSAGKEVGDTVASLELRSKGVELNPLKILGMSDESFKWDDLLKMQNEKSKNETSFLKQLDIQRQRDANKGFKQRADKLGIGEVFTGDEVHITRAQQQVLNKAEDLQRMNKELETRLSKLNLTPSTVQNFVSGDINKAVQEVQAIDQQLKALGGKRSDLALINDTASKASIKEIDKQIDALTKKRKDKASPLTNALGNIDEIKKQLDDVGKAIEADDSLPLQVKNAYKKLLEPQKEMVDDTVTYLKEAGLYDAIKPLENIWQRVTETLHDAELQFEKTKQASNTAYKETQARIYTQATDKGGLDTALETAELDFLQETQQQVSGILAQREAALKELLSISGVETNAQRKEEVERLREEITKGKDEVVGLNLEIAKSNAERQLRFKEVSDKIDEYYKGIAEQAIETESQITKQLSELENQQFANQINRAMMGAGDSIVSQFVGSLLDAINQISQAADTDIDAQSQIMQAQKNFETAFKGGEDLRKQLPEITNKLPALNISLDIDTVASNNDIKALNTEINKGVGATEKLNEATQSFNTTVADSGNLIASNTAATDNLQGSVDGVTDAMSGSVQATGNLNDAVSTATDSAGYLQTQVDANTTSVEGTNSSMQSLGLSIDANAGKTGEVITKTNEWYNWLGTAGILGGLTSVWGAIKKIGDDIGLNINKTVDWFKTFANNIPILNTISQTLGGWGQSIANSSVGQAVGGAIDVAKGWIGDRVNDVKNLVGQAVGQVGKYSIVESVGRQIQSVNSYRDLEKHHPSAGREAGRSYGNVAGEFEEIRRTRDGRTLVKKDFVLTQNGSQAAAIPAMAAGFVKVLNDAVNTVQIYADKEMTQLIGQSLHMRNIAVKTGDFVKYGQRIGTQSDKGSPGAIHAHIELEVERFTKYIQDLKDGVFEGTTGKEQAHQLGDGHNHYGEEDIKKANQMAALNISTDSNAGASGKGRAAVQQRGVLWGKAAQYAPSDLGGLTGRGQKAVQALQNANVRAFLDAVAAAELGNAAAQKGGYGYLFGDTGGKETFNPNTMKAHPGRRVPFGRSASSATGRYQAMDFVWKEEAPRLGLRDMKPQSQEIIAVSRMMYRGILDQVMRGDIQGALKKARNEWASLEGNPYNQGTGSGKTSAFMANFQQALQQARTGGGGSIQGDGNAGLSGRGNISGGSVPQVYAPPANVPIPQVWTPDSVARTGNQTINRAQAKAAQQRDAQTAVALQQSITKAETDSIQGLQKASQSLIQVEKQLRQSGYETRDLFEDIDKMNTESLGALTLPEQRKQKLNEIVRQYRDSREKINEKVLDVQNRQTAAQAILGQPSGVLTPAVREKFNKLLSMPIADDLKARLQEAMTTGVFGDQLQAVLQKSVTQGNQEIATLQKAAQALETGEKGALKAAQERFDFEEKARAKAAAFELESLNIATLQARLDQLKGQADRDPYGDAAKQLPAMEKLVGLRQSQLDFDKQIEELEKGKRDKSINATEADAQIKALKDRKAIAEQTIKENTAYQEITNARAKDARNREISLQAAKDELSVSKQQLEALKALPTQDPNRAGIPLLEYQIELQELQLKLQEDIAAVQESVFKDPSSKAASDTRIAKLKEEYELNQKNLSTRLKQQTAEQDLAQQRSIIGIREQELGFAEQLLEAQAKSYELGIASGDPLDGRFELQTQRQVLDFEKQILDVKELALESGKSADEVAAIEAKLREINNIQLDNIQGEMEKAFSDRAFAVQQRVGESSNSVLTAQQSLMSTYGFTQEASKIGKQIAVSQQQMDFVSQKRELEEFIKTNVVAADQAALLRDNLSSINDIKFREIEAQFNPLKGVIDSSVGALKGAFKSLIKDGKVDFDSFFDGILDSIADFLSNMLVEKLMGFLSPNKDKSKGGGMFPDATADPSATKNPFAGIADPTGLINGGDSIFGSTDSMVGTSAVSPAYVNVVNANQMGFGQPMNNIVPFNSPGWGGGLFGGQPDYISATTDIFGDLGSFFDMGFSGYTDMNPLPVGLQEAQPNIFGSLFGGAGGGGIGGILGSLTSAIGGGGGIGGIISAVLPMLGSLFGGLFAEGGVIGTGKSKKDDQLILAQRGEGILTHRGMQVIGGAAALNAINRSKGYRVPKFAVGGVVGGEYGVRGADAVERGQAERNARRNEPIKLETTVINNQEYLTVEQGRQLAADARQMGAKDGVSFVQSKMENSVTWRNRFRL